MQAANGGLAPAASDAGQGMVEVLEPHDRAFFKAAVLDVDSASQRYLVRYLGEDEVLWVDAGRVRGMPPPRPMDFNPREGEKVEVSFSEEGEFESWWEGDVRKEKGGFYFVSFPDEGESETHEVVEIDRLRPAYGNLPAQFEKRIFHVPPKLEKDMLLTQDSLPKVAKVAQLFALNLSPDGKQLVALGAPRSLETVETLINMHYGRLPQLAKMSSWANNLQHQVSDYNETLSKGIQVSFKVDQDLLGMVIGSKGANIKRAQALQGVSRIDTRKDGTVVVWAETKQQAERAREMLEIVTEVANVAENEIGFIIGKGGRQINELEKLSGCRINKERDSPVISIAGVRGNVNKAKALLQYTLETLREQREKERVISELTGELRNLGLPYDPFQGEGYGLRFGGVQNRGAAARGMRGRGAGMLARGGGPPQPARGPVGVQNGGGVAQARGGGAQQARGAGAARGAPRGAAVPQLTRGGGGGGGGSAPGGGPVAQRPSDGGVNVKVTLSQTPAQNAAPAAGPAPVPATGGGDGLPQRPQTAKRQQAAPPQGQVQPAKPQNQAQQQQQQRGPGGAVGKPQTQVQAQPAQGKGPEQAAAPQNSLRQQLAEQGKTPPQPAGTTRGRGGQQGVVPRGGVARGRGRGAAR